ncbi:Uncharacterised protein [Legionella beliardensis]|uniref:DUF4189 domain-containing protein n=1 Tax=Legionella beliardensis TaxID=91822 RepID=A0A378I2K3_9GAMM|nr:hypothetical protein [Legionella beliardensis]STX28931.1 Uncharacterised protein [Legionella beliardensis]
MNKKSLYCIVPFSFYAQFALAQWHCIAEDGANRQWLAISNYQRSAINRAMEVCKKESHEPSSCKTSKANCDLFVNGISTKPAWQCTALDQMAVVWRSNSYSNRDDAALAAKAYCQENSGFPDTCYVNLLTCKNINRRNINQ